SGEQALPRPVEGRAADVVDLRRGAAVQQQAGRRIDELERVVADDRAGDEDLRQSANRHAQAAARGHAARGGAVDGDRLRVQRSAEQVRVVRHREREARTAAPRQRAGGRRLHRGEHRARRDEQVDAEDRHAGGRQAEQQEGRHATRRRLQVEGEAGGTRPRLRRRELRGEAAAAGRGAAVRLLGYEQGRYEQGREGEDRGGAEHRTAGRAVFHGLPPIVVVRGRGGAGP